MFNTKQERLRQSRLVHNEQSNSMCWANQSNKDWDWDKSTTSRTTRGVEQNRGRTIETETSQARLESLSCAADFSAAHFLIDFTRARAIWNNGTFARARRTLFVTHAARVTHAACAARVSLAARAATGWVYALPDHALFAFRKKNSTSAIPI